MYKNGHDASDKIHSKGKPALLLAAQYGSITIVKKLLQALPPDSILAKDYEGCTALALASYYNGNTEIAKLLVAKNSDLLTIPDTKYGLLPITWAFSSNFIKMGRYLYDLMVRTPLEPLDDPPVASLFFYCLKVQCLDIALELLQKRQELLVNTFPRRSKYSVPTAVNKIATLNTRIRSCSDLSFWERWIYNLDIQQYSGQHDQAKMNEPGCHGLRQRFINSITNLEDVKKMKELRRLHEQVDALYGLVSESASEKFALNGISEALGIAAQEGNADFVLKVSKKIPEKQLQQVMFDCFSKALEYRQVKVFNLIHGYRYKPLLINTIDSDDASLLHKVAKRAPEHILDRIYAPTLQIQRELQWFKEVESLFNLSKREDQNTKGLTAKELFRKEHKELMKVGEKWIKQTASSCSVVGALIVTIMFAAAYTVPGGNDQNFGYPLFIKQPYLTVFIFSTILSFLLASTSLLIFLAIITSQYSEEQFLKSLPIKLISGIVSLFISIVAMMIAFLSTTYLMLKHTHYVWGLVAIVIIAIVPIVLFMWFQGPLLWHTGKSTFRKIFDRKVEPWP